jgi:tetratricopeptide (TPR) repeat protein
MNQEAELSRDRKLMVKALYYNGARYSYFLQSKDFLNKSIEFFNKGLTIAKQNKLDKEIATGCIYIASVYIRVPDLDKSLNFAAQASSVVQSIRNDSLQAITHVLYGNIYKAKKERLLALRSYLNALRIAEEKKDNDLLRSCYSSLSEFYADIEEYDKAIDYAKLAFDILPFTTLENVKYQRAADIYNLGNLYVGKKDFEMSVYYFEKSISVADSLNYAPLKVPGYNGLLNQYIRAKQPQKALDYFNKSSELKQFINNFGFGHAIDDAYAVIFTQLGKYDSALYYFEKAAPGFEAKSTPASRLGFYAHYAQFYNRSGDTKKAIEYYSKAKNLADEISNLEWQQDLSKELDSLYAQAGDYKQSLFYNRLYTGYRDSLEQLGQEKDLLQMELDNEHQRQARIEREKAEKLRERHNIQYLGITIGIAVVFLLLVLMGAFKVSEATIKIMGFFAFILLFEFIILLADNKIHHWTHGEPLPILGIKIILIAMLLPLHHWLEHRVVTYLASRRLIIPDRKSIWKNIVTGKKQVKQEHVD